MPTSIETTQDAVLDAYAAASRRAESRLEFVRLRYQPPLTAATVALKQAEQEELKAIGRTYDNSCRVAYRQYETAFRKAGHDHGLAMTAAIVTLEEARSRMQLARSDDLMAVTSCYQTAASQYGPEHPACQPLFDAMKSVETRADALCLQKEEEAYALYLQEKQRQDDILAASLETILEERRRALETAQSVYDQEKEALLGPLQENLRRAQANFDQAMDEAQTNHLASRQARLSIYAMLQDEQLTPSQAVR